MEPTTIVLRSRRRQRAQAVQKLQHLAPAVILLGEGLNTISKPHLAGAELALGLLEVVSGTLFVVAVAAGVRRAARRSPAAGPHHHHHRHGIDWVDVFAAAVVFAETVERYHRTGHIVRPNVLMIVTLLLLAVFHDRVTAFAEHRRALRLSDEGLSIGGRPFRRRLSAAWNEIRAIDVHGRFATIALKSGRSKRIDLDDLEDPEPVRAALEVGRHRIV